ncbi:MAG: alpha-L-fucosidase [Ruminococcaceae bacterium]|nr:alpha-L-fucosidase [Oscillospiraceae bacterium]
MDNREWFKNAGYGMMAHWGLYSLLGGEWKGRRVRDYAEWIQSWLAIPNAEYSRLADIFNPIYFNADEWIRLARDSGMKYFVFTSKHHDGFAMFKSADPFNIVDATPFGRDVTAELAEACYKYGLKFGLYYSQELDWHHPHGGGYTNLSGCSGSSWDNNWDFRDRAGKDFSICFEEKIKPQVKEILTGYGDLCLIWFDVPHTITKEQSLELNRLVKVYQPDCLINSRIGNGAYDYVSLGDNEYPTEFKVIENSDPNSIDGIKYSPYGLYETAGTLNSSWGYKYYDQSWITSEEIIERRERLNSMGINYLLNVGPDGLGRIPSFSAEALLGAKRNANEK